jgi:integrase
LTPFFAFGAFSGISPAELSRLVWSAVDLDRRIIEVPKGQAKTASRRVIPITENLAAWLEPLERKGKVVPLKNIRVDMAALARALKIEWPHNVLRHTYISYRIATVKSANQVALEAGNSPDIIFEHYRELTTEKIANEWFRIQPKDGQSKNTFVRDTRIGRSTLNGVVIK